MSKYSTAQMQGKQTCVTSTPTYSVYAPTHWPTEQLNICKKAKVAKGTVSLVATHVYIFTKKQRVRMCQIAEVYRITANDADSGIRGRISYGFYGLEVTIM